MKSKRFYLLPLVVLLCVVIAGVCEAQTRTATIQLNWQDTSNNEDGFNVYKKLGDNSYELLGKVAANALTYSHQLTGPEGSSHCFAVTAFNKGGESARSNDACANIPVTAVTALPLIMEKKPPALPEFGAVQITLTKPAGATRSVLVLEAYDPDVVDEGEFWVNGNGPIPIFGAAGTSANQQKVAMIELDLPLKYFVDGQNTLRFSHTKTDGYKINSVSVRFELSLASPSAPSSLTLKFQ